MSKFICFLAILCVALFEVALAAGRCPIDTSLKIEQTQTGRSIKSKPEWKVKISNICACTLSSLKFLCPKFLATVEVNPPIVSIDADGHCLVTTVNPLAPAGSIEFTYAWDPVQFQPLDFIEACS